MSEVGWIDFSSTDRERVSQLLSMLTEPGTLDELGVGQIRDTFSDSLFPGFSTIQTRARYLIAVPQIFQDYFRLSHKERSRITLETFLREAENNLASYLVANHAGQEAAELGIIGRTLVAKGGAARRPASIYWNGLRRFGLIRTRKSLAEFCRSAYKKDELASMLSDLHEEGNDAPDVIRQRNIVCVGPDYGDGWMKHAVLHLSKKEAEFLQSHIRYADSVKDSVPAQLIEHGLLTNALGGNYGTFAQLADWMKQEKKVSNACRNALSLAQEFSRVMEGAQIRLDGLIANRLKNDDLIKSCGRNYEQWREQAAQQNWLRLDAPEEWIGFLPENVRLRSLSKTFVRNWNRMLLENRPLAELDALVEKQAIDNKKERSILKRSLDSQIYQPGSHALQYRWFQVQRILRDIQEGLTC